MALNVSTPGVYVQEISTLPPSVAPVATAIPGFIGYTEKGTLNTPVRITSMLEYQANFGGPCHEMYSVDATTLAVTVTLSNFCLYYNMQMYFANGGGPCYVVSAGDYSGSIASSALNTSVSILEQVDEVTLIVVPEAVASGSEGTIYDTMLKQCSKLDDRFSIFDVKTTTSITTDATNFRGLTIDLASLKYGAAYYPLLNTSLIRYYLDQEVVITAGYPAPNNKLISLKSGKAASVVLTLLTIVTTTDIITFTQGAVSVSLTAKTTPVTVNEFKAGAPGVAGPSLSAVINAHPILGSLFYASNASGVVTVVSKTGGSAGIFTLTATANFGAAAVVAGTDNTQNIALYNSIKALLDAYTLKLYPSAAMAGIYAAVDGARGVWKAPANVSLSLVDSPAITISDEDQGPLNIDATSGKSINAIRKFSGKGILVWGARTLDGNSNEWRYINVRRLFIMAEESCKKASEFVVFEPNDKNTWLRVKGMIGNFLTNLWRDGALAGAKPEDAFFVKVGLGETMTPQDILEGRMIVQIGLAAVRPAEFIILQFMHKLQEA